MNVKLAFYSFKLSKFIKVHKDVNPNNLKKNVIYEISCTDCNATYVGQIKRKLLSEFQNTLNSKNHINRNTISVITDHRLYIGHKFD